MTLHEESGCVFYSVVKGDKPGIYRRCHIDNFVEKKRIVKVTNVSIKQFKFNLNLKPLK